ncbi:MAG: hypothetical protein ACRCY4_03830 [Brevinema sp.]
MKTLIAFILSCMVSGSIYAQTIEASVSETFRVSVSSDSERPTRGPRGFERPGRDRDPRKGDMLETTPPPPPAFDKDLRKMDKTPPPPPAFSRKKVDWGKEPADKQEMLKKLAEELARDVPALPKDPAFAGLEGFPKGEMLTNDNGGSVLELWFRQEGISERDIKMLSQLPNDQKALIRKIVQSYQIDMQRAILDLRPSYQRIAGELELLKVELSRALLDVNTVSAVTPTKLLKDITSKEEEMNNLSGVREKLITLYRTEMKDQIAAIVNSWISAQASKSQEDLANLFQDAESTYGLNWD